MVSLSKGTAARDPPRYPRRQHQHPPLGQDDVDQIEQAGQLRLVIGKTLVANSLVAESVEPMTMMDRMPPSAANSEEDFMTQPGDFPLRRLQIEAFAASSRI